jgi:aspartate dehydrogenase
VLRLGHCDGPPLRVGLIGAGHVGRAIAEGCVAGRAGNVLLVGVFTRHHSRFVAGGRRPVPVPACGTIEELLEYRPDVVVEAASAAALAELGPRVLAGGAAIVALSASCLSDPKVERQFRSLVTKTKRNLYIPSGAADGIEFLLATRNGDLQSVELTVTWATNGEVPGYKGTGDPQQVFDGSARDAARLYPRQLNFVVTVGLAGLGLDKTRVRVLLDPKAAHTYYRLEAIAKAYELRTTVELPRHDGRRGRLAALSGLQALRELSCVNPNQHV